jgi:hypothetical protein
METALRQAPAGGVAVLITAEMVWLEFVVSRTGNGPDFPGGTPLVEMNPVF